VNTPDSYSANELASTETEIGPTVATAFNN